MSNDMHNADTNSATDAATAGLEASGGAQAAGESGAQTVVILGGHGKVGLQAARKLAAHGHEVTSVIRDPAQADDVEATGAKAAIADLTELDVDGFTRLVHDADTVVWSAGAGGRGGAEATYAVDRDAALTLVDALEALGQRAPRLVLVSYVGSRNHPWHEGDDMYAYGEAKQAVDERLAAGVLFDHVVLAPGVLTDEPAGGWRRVADRPDSAGPTSRELVAVVIAQLAGHAGGFPHAARLPFVDGDDPVDSLELD